MDWRQTNFITSGQTVYLPILTPQHCDGSSEKKLMPQLLQWCFDGRDIPAGEFVTYHISWVTTCDGLAFIGVWKKGNLQTLLINWYKTIQENESECLKCYTGGQIYQHLWAGRRYINKWLNRKLTYVIRKTTNDYMLQQQLTFDQT